MMKCVVDFGEGGECDFVPQSTQELLDRLRAVPQNMNPGERIVTITLQDSQDVLSVGVGDRLCMLSFMKADKMPPYYSSRGTENTGEDLAYYMGGHWTELDVSFGIPESDAMEAARYFVEKGERDPKVTWGME